MIEMALFAGVWTLAGIGYIWWRQRMYLNQLNEMNDFVEELLKEGLHASKMTDEEMEELNDYLAAEFPLVMKDKKLERM